MQKKHSSKARTWKQLADHNIRWQVELFDWCFAVFPCAFLSRALVSLTLSTGLWDKKRAWPCPCDKRITSPGSRTFKVGPRGYCSIIGMGRGRRFLGKVDFEYVPWPSDSLLPVLKGKLIGHIGSEAGRGQVTDKTEVSRAGLGLAALTRN